MAARSIQSFETRQTRVISRVRWLSGARSIAMDQNILQKVKKELSLKNYATNDAWLRDCVEYYLGEQENANVGQVLEFVISQWQLSDLREISNEKPCLPENLDRLKCTTLQGNFVLQMEKVYDISESKYKQIEKIRNLSNENAKVTTDEKNQTWEPKKRRMLRLELTDGCRDVVAIEYQPVAFLDDKILPGYKLLIKGPVSCRRGIIMLDNKNVARIGGEVANLLIPNAPENILARALNLPENPDPYGDENGISSNEILSIPDEFNSEVEDIAGAETARTLVQDASDDRKKNERLPDCPISRTESDLIFEEMDDLFFDDDAIFQNVVISEMNIPKNDVKIDLTSKPNPGPSFRDQGSSTRRSFEGLTISENGDIRPTKRSKEVEATETRTSRNETEGKTSGNKRTAAVLSPLVRNQSKEKIFCSKTSEVKGTPKKKKITDYLTRETVSKVKAPKPEILDKISDLKIANPSDSLIRKTIKARVTKFDNLSKNGQCWQLNATITDETGSIDVEFSSKILESMLGFSVAEFSQKKKLKKTDPNMESYLRQGFRNAEMKVSQLNDTLIVEVAPKKKPKIVEVKSDCAR